MDSGSWYITIKRILVKYGLPEPVYLLNNPPTNAWKSLVNKQINLLWIDNIKKCAGLYSSLQNLSIDDNTCGKIHYLIQSTRQIREIHHIRRKLNIAIGTYILQTNRTSFNQNQVDPTCMVFKNSKETVQHFQQDCTHVRKPIMDSILETWRSFCTPANNTNILMHIIADCSALRDIKTGKREHMNIEFHSIKLCFALDNERYKRLLFVPLFKRAVKPKKAFRGLPQQAPTNLI